MLTKGESQLFASYGRPEYGEHILAPIPGKIHILEKKYLFHILYEITCIYCCTLLTQSNFNENLQSQKYSLYHFQSNLKPKYQFICLWFFFYKIYRSTHIEGWPKVLHLYGFLSTHDPIQY